MDITIYSTPTCPHCVMAKKFLKEKNIPFTDIDVAADTEKAEEMIKLSGQMGVPVIKIDDQIVVGFDQGEIEKIISTK